MRRRTRERLVTAIIAASLGCLTLASTSAIAAADDIIPPPPPPNPAAPLPPPSPLAATDPNPDYDASDEVEFFFNYFTWGLRGVVTGDGYPPPAYPPV